MSGAGKRGGSRALTNDTLTLIADGQARAGWQTIRVTRAIEQLPSTFAIGLADRFPGKPRVVVAPGAPCQVMIGDDLVITGYIDRWGPSFSATAHGITASGRGKCQDLVDCSAGINQQGQSAGMAENTSSVLTLANKLAAPFGITASVVGGADVMVSAPNGGPLFFNITLTETPAQIIEEVARYAGLLAYDDTDGNLLLARVGVVKMASGFQQGVNVQDADVTFTADERYSVYVPSLTSQDSLSDMATPNQPSPVFSLGSVSDQGVKRFRPLIVVSEQFVYGQSIALLRATWEMNRRIGRSQMVRLVCDSWRDSAGKLWEPNAIATVDLPALHINSQDWVIASVSFVRDLQSGSTAEIVLMPKQAFSIEPSTLQPFDWQISQSLTGGSDKPTAGVEDPSPNRTVG